MKIINNLNNKIKRHVSLRLFLLGQPFGIFAFVLLQEWVTVIFLLIFLYLTKLAYDNSLEELQNA